MTTTQKDTDISIPSEQENSTETTPKQRKRGRPAKSNDITIQLSDFEKDEETPKQRKRGRPAKSSTQSKKKVKQTQSQSPVQNNSDIENIFKSYKEFTDQLTNLLTKKNDDKENLVIVCKECLNNNAITDCLTCGVALCAECKEQIHKFSVTKHHIFAKLGTLE